MRGELAPLPRSLPIDRMLATSRKHPPGGLRIRRGDQTSSITTRTITTRQAPHGN
ncbi:hypothetical protein ATK17_1830 [Branchiibius hedensis]|uniref:Uncharacterized protein n=1 Tax=Branchiibius hedensis TaxID=672460 RepID=A0A2Y8ZXA2_9MICO|nr:hypothetical protein [Branchiibius hedensis]PWJ25694.1 hypothetical protein ATK17_1830 [Branchiibius hedensis]SSA34507.1 hypothetical protein SAMN04489750_1830 [Branchiibius hedensis]